ncbi:MAG TPA: sigma-70 family RNA polymerase sigma factor, partial [Flavisolibacter sp.]|nr:sigma-70 family RNA polymerase sigma factor [Flavisolibacter sp.]
MHEQELIPHLFRTEFGKISSVLSKLFGIEHIETAEDIASETFLAALETWTYKGLPENPTAWLYIVAKNKTKNYLRRNRIFSDKIIVELKHNTISNFEIDLSEKNSTDSLLQMLFTICHPVISPEAQIGLSLRILCGFGVDEIATAFLTNKETINKRLFRAKQKLREEKVQIEFPSKQEIDKRLNAVLTTLYLLFSEGYYSENKEDVIREELCAEAMRLTFLLMQNEQTNQPQVNALYALMCFHSSRFAARKNNSGEMILYQQQNEKLWDRELISKGAFYLNKASVGNKISKYHLEATIAYWHTVKADTKEKWENILQLYNQLLQIEYSPIAALNRTFALSKTNGTKEAIKEAEKLNLEGNQFYFSLLGELYSKIDKEKARAYFTKAIRLARTDANRRT